jgi:hypothetical protein
MNGVATWKRRHAAALRLPLLECGCSDPWGHHCHDAAPSDVMADVMADAAANAADYLRELGFPGIFDGDTCRSMWRRGRRDLANECYRYSHGEAVA